MLIDCYGRHTFSNSRSLSLYLSLYVLSVFGLNCTSFCVSVTSGVHRRKSQITLCLVVPVYVVSQGTGRSADERTPRGALF